MREQVSNFFQNLPPEGIAIHGTNLARARLIQERGLLPTSLNNRPAASEQFYVVQPPLFNVENRSYIFESIEDHIRMVASRYSYLATIDKKYAVDSNPEESTVPAIVVVKPLRKFDASGWWTKKIPHSCVSSEAQPIPKENILGIIGFEGSVRVKDLRREIVNVINGEREIMLLEPQSPDQG